MRVGVRRVTERLVASSIAPARHLVRSSLGGTIIGVDARSVEEIDDVVGARRLEAEHLHDLAVILGLTQPENQDARRVLILKVNGRSVGLIVGEIAHVEAVPVEMLRPLPTFLAFIGARTGIRQVSIEPDGVGFVLDINALAALLGRLT